jgi:hypothetical protein
VRPEGALHQWRGRIDVGNDVQHSLLWRIAGWSGP